MMTMHLHGSVFDGKGKAILYLGRFLPAVLALRMNLMFLPLDGSQCGGLLSLLCTNRGQFLFLNS